ncbi:MAG: universal stress protein [bacterium]
MIQRYRKILVSLNLTDLDPTVVAFANLVTQLTQPDRVELVNVLNTRNLPAEVVEEYPALVDAGAESNEKRIRELVAEHIQASSTREVQLHVFRGTPVEELVRHAKSEEIDLIIVGRDPKKERSGTLPERLAREAPCSVLVVPKGAEPAIRSILVPVDFSEHSAAAFERAVAFGKAAKIGALSCLHVFDVPAGYGKAGKTYDEFTEIMKEHAEQAWRKFRRQLDPKGLEIRPLFRRAAFPSQAICDEAAEAEIDLVVMGARGQSAKKNLFVGSVSQRVVNTTHAPLLVVKSKRASAGLLDALYGIMGSA